jgi:hypothetical protein
MDIGCKRTISLLSGALKDEVFTAELGGLSKPTANPTAATSCPFNINRARSSLEPHLLLILDLLIAMMLRK